MLLGSDTLPAVVTNQHSLVPCVLAHLKVYPVLVLKVAKLYGAVLQWV